MNYSRNSPTVRVAAITVATALAVGLGACTSSETVPVPEQLRSNLAALATLPPELELAHRVVTRTCMLKAGFDLPFDSSPPRDFGRTLIAVEGLIASENSARTNGYRTTQADNLSPIDQYEEDLSASEAAEYRLAYSGGDDPQTEMLTLGNGMIVGRSTEGCLAEADIAVYGSVKDTLKAQNFINEVYGQSVTYASDTTSELGPLLAEYKTCMADKGYEVNGLNAAALAAEAFGVYRSASESPSIDEQNMAVSDFQCQTQSGFAEKLDEIFIEKSSVWIVQNEGLIIGTREIIDESKARAQAIINGS